MKDDMIPGKVNFLGRRGEHMTRVKRFYTGDVLRDYPGAEITVLNKRPGDTGSYPVAGAYCVMDGDWLEWTVQSGDLATEGFGKCEMRATVNGQIALSIVYTTEVKESLDGAEEPPEPWESWVQDVTDAADRAEAAAQLLEHPGAEAVTLEAGSQASAAYEGGTFTFGIPRGPKGEDGVDGADGADGYSPSAAVSKSGGVATVTITDKNGTTSAEIRDGTDGQDGITPAFSIGTVQKGTNAAATITGTPAAPVLNLTLPKGDKGNTGNTGPTGATPEFSIGTVETGAAGSQAAATITGTAEAPVLNLTIPRGDKGETGEVSEAEMTAAIAAASSELKSAIDRKAPCIYQDASGDIVTFADGAENMPLSSCVVSIDPVQAGEGDPSPENIRPLIGLDGCTIFRVGTPVNLFDGQMEPGEISATTGENSGASTFRSRSVNYIPYRDDLGSLYFHCPERDGNFRIFYYGAAKNFIGYNSVAANAAVTIPQGMGIRYLRFRFGSGAIADDQYISVNVPSTATGYIPHAVQTYPISWQTAAGTVYGGTLDTVTGVLTVTKKSVDLGSLNWKAFTCRESTTKYYMMATLADCKEAETNAVIGDIICEQYRATNFNVVYGGNTDLRIALSAANHRICIYDSSYNTAESETAFASAMSGVLAVYGLETPLTYQLDPVQIKTLMGYNAIWVDTGAISVTYTADTRTYVDSAIQTATDPDGNVIQVSGSTPSITGESGKRYICGTVDSLSITPPGTGIVDVVFTSGTTPTVLTINGTVRWANGFDPENLGADTVYELNIADGLGVAVGWT